MLENLIPVANGVGETEGLTQTSQSYSLPGSFTKIPEKKYVAFYPGVIKFQDKINLELPVTMTVSLRTPSRQEGLICYRRKQYQDGETER